jgi:hypothetical protein
VSHPLTDSWAKLERAKGHVDDLRAEITEAADGKPNVISLRSEYDGDTQAVVYFAERIPEVRDSWGLLIGDAIHNFRCSLDHLWWQLARKHLGREPTDKEAPAIQFPIFSSPDQWTLPHRYFRHVESADADLVEDLQPYNGDRGEYDIHPLEALAEISNTDKHRMVHVTFVRSQDTEVTLPSPADYIDCEPVGSRGRTLMDVTEPGVPIEVGDEMIRVFVRPTGPDPNVKLKANLTGYVAFRGDWEVLHSLDKIGEWVVGILDRYQPVFKDAAGT